jgi:membrane-associated protease RseP (regulator of RpoE activity)
MVEPTGFTFTEYYNESFPAAQINLPQNTLITGIGEERTTDFLSFNKKISCYSPGEEITLMTPEKNYSLVLASNPDDPEKPFLGIKNIQNEFEVREKYREGVGKIIYYLIDWVSGFLRWLFLLSLGIGLFNLLPLPIVDGGRMLQVYLHKSKGQKKGERYYRRITLFFLLVLLLNLFYPLLRSWFGL